MHNPLEIIESESLPARILRLARGLRAPRDSGAHKSAVMTLKRFFGPAFAASAVCGIVLLLLLTFVVTQAIQNGTEIEVRVIEAETVELDLDFDLPEQDPLERIETMDHFVALPDAPPSFEFESELPGAGPAVDTVPMIADAPLITRSPVILRDLYGNRSPAGRAEAVRRYGGSGRTETAVLKALRWLKRNQDGDGSWRTASTVEHNAMTGLAVLAFLAYGVTPEHEEFGETLARALRYLVSVQRPNGLFAGGRGYTHGIVTYAISEAYAMTRIMELRNSVERAVGVIIRGQQPGGGYDYDFRQGSRWDTSVAGWMAQAMKAAQLTGLSIEGLDEAMQRAGRFFAEDAWDPGTRRFRYSGGRSGGINMTGIGVLSMQLLGHLRHPAVAGGLASLAAEEFRWDARPSTQSRLQGNNPVYNLYYDTQAIFHQGGAQWERWNRMFSEALVEAQHEDGHWSGARRGGPVYATTFCVLMLTVYYRYLPTFRTPEETTVDLGRDAFSDDDVVIEIH